MTDNTTVFPPHPDDLDSPADYPNAKTSAPQAGVADQVVPGFKVVVWFNFVKGEFRDTQRVVLNGVVDIRTERDLTNVESLIREQLGFDRVFITNWRSLEG